MIKTKTTTSGSIDRYLQISLVTFAVSFLYRTASLEPSDNATVSAKHEYIITSAVSVHSRMLRLIVKQ